jgi:hypothetical protein
LGFLDHIRVPASMKHQKKPAPDHERAELGQEVESLRCDIRKLQLERDVLKKANELVKRNGHRPATPEQPGEDDAG